MTRKGKIADPHAEREAANYENPIPSREVILELLSEAEKPLDHNHIAKNLNLVEPEQLEALRKRLRAMERDGQLMVNRRNAYCLVDKMHLLHCRVQGHRDGYGFAMPIAEGEDIYLSARQMHFVFDGDEVLIQVTGEDRRGRLEGKVIEVLQRKHKTVVGRYKEESGIGFVIPDNGRLTQQILIPTKAKGSVEAGQIVTVEITDYPTRQLGAKGRIAEVLGEHLDPGMEIDVAIRSHGIPWEWKLNRLKKTSNTGLICVNYRLLLSMVRMPGILMTRFTVKRAVVETGVFGWRLPMSPIMFGLIPLSIKRHHCVATPFISRRGWYLCCRRHYPTVCVH